MRTTFQTFLSNLPVGYSGFPLLAPSLCREACVTEVCGHTTLCGRASLSQRPRAEQYMWMKFLQTLRTFNTKTEDGMAGAFTLALCGWPLPGPQAPSGGQYKDWSLSSGGEMALLPVFLGGAYDFKK